ncbi:MAG: cupin domain-containing protein [Eubacterium sp.]|jgi:transcriptional regulator with XRE-family HTH domain
MSFDIGDKIRDLRVKNGLTQEELADRAELSKGFISQVEHDLTSPSIATLEDILQCLGTSVAEFFAEDNDEQIVFGAEDYFQKKDDEHGNLVEWIIPNAQKNMMEPVRMQLEAGGTSVHDDPHEGEEFGYVLRGTVEIHVGDKLCRAKAGESFYFKCDLPHYISSARGAEIIWISTPPNF